MKYNYNGLNRHADVGELLGQVLAFCQRGVSDGDDIIEFITESGQTYRMGHIQDCCESVNITEIEGELEFLVNSPICLAEVSTNKSETDYRSQTWTFYKFATQKGYVDIRWKGESNGYYSEGVSFEEVNELTEQ